MGNLAAICLHKGYVYSRRSRPIRPNRNVLLITVNSCYLHVFPNSILAEVTPTWSCHPSKADNVRVDSLTCNLKDFPMRSGKIEQTAPESNCMMVALPLIRQEISCPVFFTSSIIVILLAIVTTCGLIVHPVVDIVLSARTTKLLKMSDFMAPKACHIWFACSTTITAHWDRWCRPQRLLWFDMRLLKSG